MSAVGKNAKSSWVAFELRSFKSLARAVVYPLGQGTDGPREEVQYLLSSCRSALWLDCPPRDNRETFEALAPKGENLNDPGDDGIVGGDRVRGYSGLLGDGPRQEQNR